MPLTGASSRAGHLQKSLGASAQRQGVGWRDLRKRKKHGGNDADARTAGHLRLLGLPMLKLLMIVLLLVLLLVLVPLLMLVLLLMLLLMLVLLLVLVLTRVLTLLLVLVPLLVVAMMWERRWKQEADVLGERAHEMAERRVAESDKGAGGVVGSCTAG